MQQVICEKYIPWKCYLTKKLARKKGFAFVTAQNHVLTELQEPNRD